MDQRFLRQLGTWSHWRVLQLDGHLVLSTQSYRWRCLISRKLSLNRCRTCWLLQRMLEATEK